MILNWQCDEVCLGESGRRMGMGGYRLSCFPDCIDPSFLWTKLCVAGFVSCRYIEGTCLGNISPEKAQLLSFLWPGELTTLTALDRERKDVFNLVAKATDGGGRSCQADITLHVEDVNDNAPRFFPSHCAVAVFDNTTVKTPVAVVFARDPDQGESEKDWGHFQWSPGSLWARVWSPLCLSRTGKGGASLLSLWTLKSKKYLSSNCTPKCYMTNDFSNVLKQEKGISALLFLPFHLDLGTFQYCHLTTKAFLSTNI